MAHRFVRGLRGALKNFVFGQQSKPLNHFLNSSTRSYVSDMRKSAFEDNILRLLRNEIQYELERAPPSKPISKYDSFVVDECLGEQWIQLRRKFGDNEEIKIEVTMFDGSVPITKNGEEDVKLHITLVIDVFKGENNDVLAFVCSAWPDSIEICKIFTRRHGQMKGQPYMGPEFKELSDELQDSLYDFLEARGIDDNLAEFLHSNMIHKDRNEYVRWMENIKSFIQKQ